MDSRLLIELAVIFFIVFVNAFFALAEFSIVASRNSRLRQLVKKQKPGAAAAEKLRADQEGFLATIQFGITLTVAILGVFSGATIVEKIESGLVQIPIGFIADHANSLSMVLVVVAITMLSVVVGELTPKYIALSSPERFASLISRPILLFVRFSSVFSKMLAATARLFVRVLGVRRNPSELAVTEDEINQMLIDGREKGLFEEAEQRFIRSVFEFTDSTVRRAMKPRTDVVALDKGMLPDEVVAVMVEHGFSRFPVFDGTIDTVVGILYVKDFIAATFHESEKKIESLMREPYFVPDSFPLPRLLKAFRTGRGHMAIVLDEFGGTAGIITLEDILEELVGEIQDEYDVETPPVVMQSENVVYADGSVWPGEINRVLTCSLPEDTAETLAGLFMDIVGHLPEKNETLRVGDATLTILARDHNRIIRMKIEKSPGQAESQDS